MNAKIIIELGALSDDLSKQLDSFGLCAPKEKIEHLQQDADAISRLNIRGLISDSAAKQARQRLMKRIVQVIAAKK